MWHEQLNLRSGDASLNTCIIYRASCMLCAWKALWSLTRKWNCKAWWYGSLWIVGWEFWFESHVHSCVGDVKRCFVERICVVVCVFDCVECVWQLGSLRSVRLSTSSPDRSFERWSCWMKAGYFLDGQSQLQCCAKCSPAPTNSLRIVRKAKPSFQKAKYLKTRPSWPQWCTYRGYSETKNLLSGSRTTRSLGPTPRSCDVTTWTRVVYVYILVYMYRYIHIWQYRYLCTYKHIYKYIRTYIHTYTNTDVCMYIYIYVCIHTYTYVHIHISMYICLKCCVFERLSDRMTVCSELLVEHPMRITFTHTHVHTHTRFNLGLVERKEYMWHSDCPKESKSDEVLYFSIKMPNLSCCLENSSQFQCLSVHKFPSMVTALRHGWWMDEERFQKTYIKEKQKREGIHQTLYGTWVVDFMLRQDAGKFMLVNYLSDKQIRWKPRRCLGTAVAGITPKAIFLTKIGKM